MPMPRRNRQAVVVRRAARPRSLPSPTGGSARVLAVSSVGGAVVSQSTVDAARRIGESFIVAAVTSAGLYLVGSVYTDSYYRRLSIEPVSLDLAPSFIALQSAHALRALLEFPSTLLLLYILYRTFSSQVRRFRTWFDRARQRFPRLVLIVTNLIVISPLLVSALQATLGQQTLIPDSVLAEVTSGLEDAAVVLLIYVIWLGWSQRVSIISQLRERKLIPIALIFSVYLLNALASTAASAELAAELLMTGVSDASMSIEFTMKPGFEHSLAGKDLIFVADRFDTYYVVERQPIPPSQRPMSHMIPGDTVAVATVRRVNDADASFDQFGANADAIDRLDQ
jgi:hypothetical protein